MEVKISREQSAIFIVDDNFELPQNCSCYYLYKIDPNVYRNVKKFTDLFIDSLSELLQFKTVDIKCDYWEKDYHTKIVTFLSLMWPRFPVCEIANSLTALGY